MSGTTNGNQRNPRRVAHRRRAGAPPVDINIDPSAVDDLQTEMAEFEDLRAILTYGGQYTAIDNHYGERTYLAILQIAKEAGIVQFDANDRPINPEVISQINFREKTGDLYTRWHTALQNHHKENETPQQVVTRVEQRTGPSDEELTATAEAARLAALAADRAAADARVDASIRGTEYDPRNIARLDRNQRRELMIRGLHAVDELRDGDVNRNHDHDKIFDKMAETIRRVNREAGRIIYPELQEHDDPLSDSALEALGRRVAMAGGIRGTEESIYRAAETQDQLNAAAARGLRALDRTASGRYDPTDPDNAQRLQRNIRKFEREVMGLSRVEADGIADANMLAALEQALRERGGLAQVTGGQAVVAAAVTAQPPAPTPARPAADEQRQPG